MTESKERSPESERTISDEQTGPPSQDRTKSPRAMDATQSFSPSPIPDADIEFKPGTRFGPYTLLEKLGQGGMGAVYKVRHEHLDKLFALKVLPSELTNKPDIVTRFQREMRSVGKLEHNNIVRATDGGEVAGTHYLVMEYVEGSDLTKLVANNGRCKVNNACVMMHQASQGLLYAHRNGLIHRDIKPSNLLLTKQGQVKILDLGLARLMDDSPQRDQSLTAMGMIMGTPDFMAPEQWQDVHSADHRTDLYAIGCTLFFLLTGKVPFGGEKYSSWMQKMRAHSMEQPPSLRSLRPDIPESLEILYQKLMAKDPADRVQSADELAKSLANIVRELKNPNTKQASANSNQDPTASSSVHPAPSADTLVSASSITTPNTLNDFTYPDLPWVSPPVPQQTWPTKSKDGRGYRGNGIRKWIIAGGAGACALLLGVIVITITNRDGSKTVIEVPGDAQRVEIAQHGKPNVTISNAASEDSSKTPNPPMPPGGTLDYGAFAVDFNAERRAAEKWQQVNKGRLLLTAEDGVDLGPLTAAIPSQNFYIRAAELYGVDLSNEELEILVGCKRLQLLNLGNNARIKVANLKKFGPMIDLKSLTIEGDDFSDLSLEFLSGYPALEELFMITGQSEPPGLAMNLPPMPNLRVLQHLNVPGDDGLARIIKHCPKIEQVVARNPGITSLLPLAGCASLRGLHTWGTLLDEPTMRTILAKTQLSELYVDIPDARTLGIVAALDNKITTLSLRNQMGDDIKMDPTRWSELATLTNLEKLSIGDGIPLNAEFLKVVASLPKLKSMQEGYDGDPAFQPTYRQYTAEDVAALHAARPDMFLRIARKEYPVVEAVKVAPKVITKSYRPPVTLSPPPELPPLILKMPAMTPISARAHASAPAQIKELASWSVELAGHIGGIGATDVSPDLSQIVTVGCNDDTIRLWRVTEQTGGKMEIRCERTFLGDVGWLFDVSWSPDGHTLAVSSFFSNNVALYDVKRGRRLGNFLLKPNRGGRAVWSPDGRFVLAAHGGPLAIIDVVHGTIRHAKDGTPGSAGIGGSWSPDGNEIATIDETGEVKFWNPFTLDVIGKLPAPRGSVMTGAISWSPDGKWLAIGGDGGKIAIIDSKLKRVVVEKVDDANQVILNLAWERPHLAGAEKHVMWPRLLVTGTAGSTVWNADLTQKLAKHEGMGHCLKAVWSADNRAIIADQNGIPRIYDSESGKLVAQGELTPRLSDRSRMVHISSDGKTLRTICGDELSLFNAESGDYVKKVGKMPANRAIASPKDDWLAVYDIERDQDNLYLVDTSTYEQRKPLIGHTGKITGANWSPDSKLLLTSGMDGSARVWKASDASLVLSLKHERAIRNAIWSPDGKSIATCAEDDQIRIWSLDSGKEEKKYGPIPSPSGWGSTGIAWNPTSNVIAIAPQSAMPTTLEMKTGKFNQVSFDFQGSLNCISWSPDGKQFLFGNHAEMGYGTITAKNGRHQFGVVSPIQWMSDNRRSVSAHSLGFPVQAIDMRRNLRLGSLYTQFHDGSWLCIGADGHYRGSEGIESKLMMVALHKDGSQTTHTPDEFQKLYNWKNDAESVSFLKLRERRSASK